VAANGNARLEVRGLDAGWGTTTLVRGADLEVSAGEIVGLLGGNGSGKSTMLWAIAGLLRPRRGTIHLDGRRVDGLAAERLATLGLRLLPQTRRVFPSLTVRENLEAVELAVGRPDLAATRARRDVWLERFPVLANKADLPAATLSGGQQQLLALGRVLSSGPGVLMLDEPSAGLSPPLVAECGDLFVELAATGVAVLLVEQHVSLARRLADRVLRMSGGRPVPDDPTSAGPPPDDPAPT
jgi:branched-chain amino acid transport system ATP-binding protein